MKKLRKYFCFLSLLSSILLSCMAQGNDLEVLVKDNEFDFDLVNFNGTYGGSIYNKHDIWECNLGRDFLYFGFDSRDIVDDRIELAYLSCNFVLYGNPSYRFYSFPKKTVICISKDQIIKRINSLKKGNYSENRDIDKNIIFTSYEVECNGLSIAENVRIRESSSIFSDVKVLGKLKKFQKIKILDTSENIDTIDGLKSCWFKIKTEEGIEGWIFGGFAKIYFSDEDLELLYKAFEKEGSEYTNQFPTPDNS